MQNVLCNTLCRRVRVFQFQSGSLRRTYDESLAAANELQRGESEMYHLEAIDFGRRMAGEKELLADPQAPQANAIFDESGNFIIFATLLGIKVSLQPTLQPAASRHRGGCGHAVLPLEAHWQLLSPQAPGLNMVCDESGHISACMPGCWASRMSRLPYFHGKVLCTHNHCTL